MADEARALLLVKAQPDLRASLKQALAVLDVEVLEVSSCDEALGVLSLPRVACVLVDVRMPGLERLDAARQARASPVALLLLTPQPREEARLVCGFSQGAVDMLSASPAPEELASRVRALLAWQARERERRDETLIRERYERLHAFLTQAPAIINVFHGPEHTFEFVNERFLQLLGERAFLGKTVREAQPELEGQGIYELLDRVYRSGELFQGDTVPVHVSPGPGLPTREQFYSFTYHPLRAADGRVQGVGSFAFDVSEIMRTQRELEVLTGELRHSEEQLRLIFEGVREYAIFLVKPDGRIASWNPGVERVTGYVSEEFIGRPFAELFLHEERRLGLPEHGLRLAASQGFYQDEGPRVRKDGTPFDAEVVVQALRSSRGEVRAFVKVMRDISQRKHVEAERERLLHERGEAVRLRDSFLSVAGHELRTPLTPLRLKLEGLSRSLSTEGGTPFLRLAPKDLDVMRRQVRRLTELVNDLLDVSRLDVGPLSLAREPVDLGRLVREVAERFEPQAERCGSGLDVFTGGEAVGSWDRSRLEQVVERLLSNALKFGAGKPVHLRVEHDTAHARLIVRDEGIGFSPESRERIFHKFERGVSDAHYGGLGLGLYFTRRIVEAMGGRVSAESLPGEGATFTVELPRSPG